LAVPSPLCAPALGCDFRAAFSRAFKRRVGARPGAWQHTITTRLDAAAVTALQHGDATGDARLDAVRVFAEAVVATRGNVDDAALAAFRAADRSEQQVLEVVPGVSLATLCNFADSLARRPVNPQLQPDLPGNLQRDGNAAHGA
jgi:alkylhydroperoxidase family enzyme